MILKGSFYSCQRRFSRLQSNSKNISTYNAYNLFVKTNLLVSDHSWLTIDISARKSVLNKVLYSKRFESYEEIHMATKLMRWSLEFRRILFMAKPNVCNMQ